MFLHFEVVPAELLIGIGVFFALFFILFSIRRHRAAIRARDSVLRGKRRSAEWKIWGIFMVKNKQKRLTFLPTSDEICSIDQKNDGHDGHQ